jgi:Trypsin
MPAILAALAAFVVTLVPASTALAGGKLKPGPEVAPGVFLAQAPQGQAGNQQAPRSGQRIVGGTTTTIGAWPWQAAITANPAIYAGNGFQRQFCGGSLVAPTIIITAAHCTFDVFDSDGDFDAVSNFASITGRTTLSNGAEGQEIAWANYFVLTGANGNPLYNPNTSDFDAVFAQLASPSSVNSSPIAIAGANEAASWAPGDENAFATGWGTTTSGGLKSDTLRQVQLDILADSVCGSPTSYGTDFHRESMLCAGEVTGGQDTCQGDSGGPLVVPIGGGTFRLVGDTSFGNGCALPNFPGVYGRLAAEPMCSALQNGIQSVAGVDVVGPGGCPVSSDAPPETTITKGPKNKTKKKKATFEFTATEPSTFQCLLDNKQTFKPCTSPTTVRVKKGKHKFAVFATDAAGNVDATPATDDWKVKKRRRK